GNDYQRADGTAMRDYVHVSDLACAHVLALQYLFDGGQSIAVNLASGQGASVREVIDTASAVTGLAIDARDSPRRPGDPSILVAEATRARELFGWSGERSDLYSILQDAWHWHRHRKGINKYPSMKDASIDVTIR